MVFYVYEGRTLIRSFEAVNHKVALAQCESLPAGRVLRDYQLYLVSPDTLVECEVWASLDWLKNYNFCETCRKRVDHGTCNETGVGTSTEVGVVDSAGAESGGSTGESGQVCGTAGTGPEEIGEPSGAAG